VDGGFRDGTVPAVRRTVKAQRIAKN
jgi:hypothetical protein